MDNVFGFYSRDDLQTILSWNFLSGEGRTWARQILESGAQVQKKDDGLYSSILHEAYSRFE